MLGEARETLVRRRRLRRSALAAAAVVLIAAPAASAHVERASYWPDPAPDSADGVPTGGEVPEVRPLSTALDQGAVGETRVVCQGGPAADPAPGGDGGSGAGTGSGAGAGGAGAVLPAPPSRAEVERLRGKRDALKRKLRKKGAPKGKAKRKLRRKRLKRKLRRVKRNLKRAKADYKQARADYDRAVQQRFAAPGEASSGSSQVSTRALGDHPSIQRLDEALDEAVSTGYVLRPSEPRVQITQQEAENLRAINLQLLAACSYDEIQPAINDSGNNDRVVVMPGVYTEPTSRAVPTNPPPEENPCEDLKEVNDRGNTGANSYAYVATCPNDQNLIAVIGREPRHDQVPQPPRGDRHLIPDEGPCIRCNLQLEGSGVGPDDVVVDGGDTAAGNGADPEPIKDVGIKADRADGFVLSNLTIRHVREHAVYPHEVDGYVLQRFKTFHAHEYGTLQFAADHGLVQDCETYGSGDAGIYPGSAPDTGEQVQAPDTERFNTEIRRCDMHHNAAGYSGTAGNAVWLHHNDFYDNALGFTTDVFTAAGHPGFPQDSDLLEHNEFYSNNFNPYEDQPDDDEVVPTIPVPVGTGMWIAGGNNNEVRDNHFWDNHRRGAMLFAVPDVLVCGPTTGTAGEQVFGCDPLKFSTSYRNEFHDNVMGRSPDRSPDPTWPGGGDEVDRNGVDFWWDQFPLNTKNCWYDNVGPDGTRSSLNTVPPINPIGPGLSLPLLYLPEDCATSIGLSGVLQEVELLTCLAAFEEDIDVGLCTWFNTPNEP